MPSILLDCERMKYPNTGLYHFCLNLGRELLKQKGNEEELSFFIPANKTGIFGDANYINKHFHHDIFVPNSKDYRLSFYSQRFDVWHMTFQSSRYRPLNPRTKIVLTIHDLNFLYEHPDNIRKRKKYLAIVQDRINQADHIVCISQYCLSDVKKYLNIGNKPVDVVYNGCTFPSTDVVQDPAYKPSGPFLLTLGTVLPKKNFHVLPCLLTTFKGELIIAGVGGSNYQKKILDEANKYGVADRVKFVGSISENDKSWYYSNCYAFLFPSIAEGFGLPVVEAMFYGKPTFLSTHTSLPEVGGPHAYYFKNFDPEHMREALKEGMEHFERAKPQVAIREWAGQFSWEKAAASYWDIYRGLNKTSSIRLSAVIITYNEEKNITRCLESLTGIADEIIVLDACSTDRTREICEHFGVRFFQQPWLGYSPTKNIANSLATGDYILSIDADEALSKELQVSILEFKKNPTADSCALNRLTDYCGRWIKHGGWYPDQKKRIFKKDIGSWEGSIHEELVFSKEHKSKKLSGDMLHYSFPTIESHIQKSLRYAYLVAARDFEQSKKRNQIIHGMTKPVFSFFRQYVFKLGFLDGYYGFVLASISSFELFMRYVFYKEIKIARKKGRSENPG